MWHPKQPAREVVAIFGFDMARFSSPQVAALRASIADPMGSWS
jgi:hypothetical protein